MKSSAATSLTMTMRRHTGALSQFTKAGSVRRMQRTLVHRLLAELPPEVADPIPAKCARAASCRIAVRPCWRRTFHRLDRHRHAGCVSTPAQQRLIFEEFFSSGRAILRKRRTWRSGSAAGPK
jgi:hypothetical protein